MMKRLCNLAARLCAIMMGALLMVQCDEQHRDGGWSAIEVDSLGVSVSLVADTMVGNEQLQQSLAQFVRTTMFYDGDEDENGIRQMPVFDGRMYDFLLACTQQKWEEMKVATFGEPIADGEEYDDEVLTPEEAAAAAEADSLSLSSYIIIYNKVYDSDSLVTWTCNYDVYVANSAHPSCGAYGITLRKSDGRALGHEILRDTDSDAFHRLLRQRLVCWVEQELEIEGDAEIELTEMLSLSDIALDALPLPRESPYLTDEGVVLPYVEGELLFVRGTCLVLIPWAEARPFINL